MMRKWFGKWGWVAISICFTISVVSGLWAIANDLRKPSDIETLHQSVLYPVVRVRSMDSGGSGTIIYSKQNAKQQYETFVLTNHHVIESAIQVTSEWDPNLRKEVKKEKRATVTVEIFQYKNLSENIGRFAMDADIVAYSARHDLGLLKLRSSEKAAYVAKLMTKDKVDMIKVFQKVFAVGCSLGHPPIQTEGSIMSISDEIESEKFWMTNAAIIFGNSGGAVFLAETQEFVGVPSRVAVTGFYAVSHMAYSIPLSRVYQWLEEANYQFVYDDKMTSEACEALRKKKAEPKEEKP